MFDFKTLITDRTQRDVDGAKRLNANNGGSKLGFGKLGSFVIGSLSGYLKGAYTAEDKNRVGNAVNDLSERFYEAGYEMTQTAKTDWTDEAEPSENDLLTYLYLIGKIRDKIAVLESTPSVPADMRFFGYEEANNIEKILADVDLLLNNSQNAVFYSGELYGGET